jgi:hypothetical protein
MRQCVLLSSMICVSGRSYGGHFVHLYIQYTRSLLEKDLIVPTQSLLTAVSCSGGTCPYTRSPLENNSPTWFYLQLCHALVAPAHSTT